ncbi:MAG: hypothetical protein HYY84_14025 [Deltaproteobacteria bacterium]|nr:hypothetical protein [Deltaproteobacteria bacterium]
MKLEFSETMTGTYKLHDDAASDRRFEFSIRVVQEPGRIEQTGPIEGTVTLEGFADRKPLKGTLQLAPLTRRALIYNFEFTANDGEKVRFEGTKNLSAFRPIRSMTMLAGTLYKEYRPIGAAQATFDLRREFPRLLASLRLG